MLDFKGAGLPSPKPGGLTFCLLRIIKWQILELLFKVFCYWAKREASLGPKLQKPELGDYFGQNSRIKYVPIALKKWVDTISVSKLIGNLPKICLTFTFPTTSQQEAKLLSWLKAQHFKGLTVLTNEAVSGVVNHTKSWPGESTWLRIIANQNTKSERPVEIKVLEVKVADPWVVRRERPHTWRARLA